MSLQSPHSAHCTGHTALSNQQGAKCWCVQWCWIQCERSVRSESEVEIDPQLRPSDCLQSGSWFTDIIHSTSRQIMKNNLLVTSYSYIQKSRRGDCLSWSVMWETVPQYLLQTNTNSHKSVNLWQQFLCKWLEQFEVSICDESFWFFTPDSLLLRWLISARLYLI